MGYKGGELRHLFEPGLAENAAHEMAEDTGKWLHDRVVANTPTSYHGITAVIQGWDHERERAPGTLKRSWYRLPVRRWGRSGVYPRWGSAVATNDAVAPFVEWDTRPHLIRPKKPGGHLRFRAWPTGEVVYAQVVKHPGTTGQHMMGTALNAARIEFKVIATPALERWSKRAVCHERMMNAGARF